MKIEVEDNGTDFWLDCGVRYPVRCSTVYLSIPTIKRTHFTYAHPPEFEGEVGLRDLLRIYFQIGRDLDRWKQYLDTEKDPDLRLFQEIMEIISWLLRYQSDTTLIEWMNSVKDLQVSIGK